MAQLDVTKAVVTIDAMGCQKKISEQIVQQGGHYLPTERFFRSMKHEHLNYEKFDAYETAKLSIIDYLAFHNGRRSHSTLGYLFPLEFEREFYGMPTEQVSGFC